MAKASSAKQIMTFEQEATEEASSKKSKLRKPEAAPVGIHKLRVRRSSEMQPPRSGFRYRPSLTRRGGIPTR